MRDEQRVEALLFNELLEHVLRDLVVLEVRTDLHAQFLGAGLALGGRVVPPLFVDALQQVFVASATPWTREVNGLGHVALGVLVLDLQPTAELLGQVANHAFD